MAIEARRGCGFRKCGGIYLVAGQLGSKCHRLPIPLHVCPTCNQGIKQARGWTWVNRELFQPDCAGKHNAKTEPTGDECEQGLRHMLTCPACNTWLLPEKVGLVWIGEKFYKTPRQFMEEAGHLGISRRVKKIPRGFKLGESWVFLAHPKAVHHQNLPPVERLSPEGQVELIHDEYEPGVFTAFKPERVEMLLKEKDCTKKKLKELEEKGITVIRVPNNDRDHQGSVYDKEKDEE